MRKETALTTESGQRCESDGWFISKCDHKMTIQLKKGAYFPHCYDAQGGSDTHEVTLLPIPDQPRKRRMPMVA